ncbi:MAG: hypothetical protein ACO3N3_17850 [bacterium]|jgi:hypothetical protein
MIDFNIKKNEDLNLYECTMTATLPPITVTKYKKSRDDFRYEMQRAINEIVDELVDQAFEE